MAKKKKHVMTASPMGELVGYDGERLIVVTMTEEKAKMLKSTLECIMDELIPSEVLDPEQDDVLVELREALGNVK